MSFFPVRCFTCNKVIGNKLREYEKKIKTTKKKKQNILASMGIHRYCCRRMFLGYVDFDDKLLLHCQNKKIKKNE